MGAYSVAADLYNVWWNVKFIPTQIRAAYIEKKLDKDQGYLKVLQNKAAKKEEKAIAKEQAKSDKEQMKMASKAQRAEASGCASDEVKHAIIKVTENDNNECRTASLLLKATNTNKIIQFAYFYMTDERGQLVKMTTTEKEIANGIAERLGFGKIYENEASATLEKYDIESELFDTTSKYILSVVAIEKKLQDNAFMEKMNKRKEALKMKEPDPEEKEPSPFGPGWERNNDGTVKPIWFTPGVNPKPLEDENTFVRKEGNLSKDEFDNIEKVFSSYNLGEKYSYDRHGDLISLFNDTGEFIIDPGYVMGRGEYGILANVANDRIFVPIIDKYKDIVTNVLSDPWYKLTGDEAQRVIEHYFRNMNIYKYIDMNKTEFLNKLSEEEFQKLGKKLTFIINNVMNSNAGQMPRMRFNHFESIDNFMIISDKGIRSPLANTGETSQFLMESFMVQVSGDDITTRYMNQELSKFHIDQYKDL